jgi:hypothetical protein
MCKATAKRFEGGRGGRQADVGASRVEAVRIVDGFALNVSTAPESVLRPVFLAGAFLEEAPVVQVCPLAAGGFAQDDGVAHQMLRVPL